MGVDRLTSGHQLSNKELLEAVEAMEESPLSKHDNRRLGKPQIYPANHNFVKFYKKDFFSLLNQDLPVLYMLHKRNFNSFKTLFTCNIPQEDLKNFLI